MVDVAIVDYGSGNLRSVLNALQAVAPQSSIVVTHDPAVILAAQRVVFPGQGAMPNCMAEMDKRGLRASILHAVAKKPFLGICIGLQMLFDSSEEGNITGLSIMPGKIRRFPDHVQNAQGDPLKVPHMGWNNVEFVRPHPLWHGINSGERFYFVHSYYAQLDDISLQLARCNYAVEFTCAAGRDNLVAVQFHPEKSQHAGLQLLRNFVQWNGVD